jgi:ribosomal protein L32
MLDTETIKADLKRKFNVDTRLFIKLNPKCPHCRKRSYGHRICLHCGAYPKFPKLN